jgi:hypothetical protein
MNESRLKILLTVLPVLSAGLYLMGATYHQGYLAAYGIDDSVFPLPTERLLFAGLITFVSFSVFPLVYSAGAVIALVAAVMIAALLSSVPAVRRWEMRVRSCLPKVKLRSGPTPTMTALVDRTVSLYAYAVGGLVVFALLLFAAVLSAKTGKEQAEREIEAFALGQGGYVDLIADSQASAVRAKLIICSSTQCAFWLGHEGLLLKLDQVKRIVTHTPSLKKPLAARPASAR